MQCSYSETILSATGNVRWHSISGGQFAKWIKNLKKCLCLGRCQKNCRVGDTSFLRIPKVTIRQLPVKKIALEQGELQSLMKNYENTMEEKINGEQPCRKDCWEKGIIAETSGKSRNKERSGDISISHVALIPSVLLC